MDSFKLIVLVIALSILVFFLAWVGTTIKSAAKNAVYPPVLNTCPDNWMSDASGNCVIPTNTAYLGKISNGDFSNTTPKTYGFDSGKKQINFSDLGWNNGGISAQCNQRDWAIGNQINWDTITNYNQC